MSIRLLRLALLAAMILAWEVLPRLGLIPPLFLPPLSQTVLVGLADWRIYGAALGVTLGEVSLALLLACGGGILGGALLASALPGRRLVLPLVASLYAVPLVILYPVFTAWFGIGPASKVAFAAVYGLFPTLLGTVAGLRTIDPHYLLTARGMGATRLQSIRHVMLPASLPTLLASLRLGGALVIVGVVVAEMLAAAAGLGFLITSSRTVLDSPRVFASVLLVLLLAGLFDLAMRGLEHALGHRPNPSAPARP